MSHKITRNPRRNHQVILHGMAVLLMTSCGSTYKQASSSTAAATTATAGTTGTTVTNNVTSYLNAAAQNASLQPNGSTAIAASGGTAPYTYTLVSGGGSVNASTGTYTAPTSDSNVVIQVTDAAGQTTMVYLSVSATITLTLSASSVQVYGTLTLSASGGTAPYTYIVSSGAGSISGNVYTAPSTVGSAIITVNDNAGRTATANVNITAAQALSVSPSSTSIDLYGTQRLTVTGGVSPYTYSIRSGPGSISGSTFIGSGTTGTTRILVQDSQGNAVTVSIVTANQALTTDCQAFSVYDINGPRSGQVVNLGGTQVCSMPVASTGTNTGTAACPSGWTAVMANGVPYTITAATSFQNDIGGIFGDDFTTVYTGSHASLSATPVEAVGVCPDRDFFGACVGRYIGYASIRNIACTE